MNAEGASWRCVSEVEVEVENVLTAHGALLTQLFEDDVEEQIAGFELACNLSQERQHVLLSAQLNAIVDLTVEVDGEVADLQQRSLDVEQHCVGTHYVLAAHDDTSGKCERTVEPCRHYRTAIHLGVELDESALA